ncbi:MAG: SCO family protein [Ktedonobacterales bacterium]
MKLRTISRLSVITLVIVVGAVIYLVHSTGAATTPTLRGTDLREAGGAYPLAPDFRLVDQSGTPVSLSQFRGRPVVLTFLYTHCPDECPLTAEKLRVALRQLGASASGVAILAVSTDPAGDDQAAAQAFSAQHQMQDRWHFLIGAHDQLAPVWKAYGIAVAAGARAGEVTHGLGLYVIDKQGRERVYLGNDFDPAAVAADLRILAGE